MERDIEACFLLMQATRLFPTQKHPPKVLFLSSAFPTQSASEYLATTRFVSLEYPYAIKKGIIYIPDDTLDCSEVRFFRIA
jgi:hypothetical protein